MSTLVKTLWSDVDGRARLALVALVCGLLMLVLLPVVAGSRPRVREIRLVARDMSFYLDGQPPENPLISVRRGEQVRVTLRNEDAGLTHNFAVKALGVAMAPLKGAGTRSVAFRAPERLGRYEYFCTPHAQMMRGVLEVAP